MTSISLFACLAASAVSAPVPKVKTPVLAVEPLADAITVGDPLDLRITFANPTAEPILTKSQPGQGWLCERNLTFEVRHDDDEQWKAVHPPEFETSIYPSTKYRVENKTGCQTRFFAFLRWDAKRGFILGREGKWRLRAALDTAGGVIRSEEITITVQSASAQREKANETHEQRLLLLTMSRSGMKADELQKLIADKSGFEGSYVGTILDRVNLIQKCLADCETVSDDRGIARFGEAIAKWPSVVKDHLRIELARALANKQRYAATLAVIDSLESSYPECDSLKAEAQKHVKK